ncbi:hypothetical protein NLJ89_g3878 [Agrocybe chaxingu]|uniref:DDE Tnp4 domain-containing protein n=1 Tax=Agrocybe chaxingu TaxID=84603 RepID=A0A9W8K3X6_9AGAR|nr:hypothetical protein NLJ89_g3878 [Agrocybe chaxingu]
MGKRRKLSDLTDQETATVVNLLKRFQLELDEDDEDGQEVVHALQTVVRKFSELKADLDDEEADEDFLLGAGATVAVILTGIEDLRQRRAERRNPSHLYLCRAQLLPDPHQNTPWQVLYKSQNDRAFITTMGFDTALFREILEAGFGEAWLITPIPRADTSIGGDPRPERRSLDAPGALGLVLHYLNSTMHEISLQEIFAIIPSTVSRYITFGLNVLLLTLRTMHDAQIGWFKNPESFSRCRDLIVARHPRLTGAFASIDGLNIPVQTSKEEDIENATYNGWLSEHFLPGRNSQSI